MSQCIVATFGSGLDMDSVRTNGMVYIAHGSRPVHMTIFVVNVSAVLRGVADPHRGRFINQQAEEKYMVRRGTVRNTIQPQSQNLTNQVLGLYFF